LLAGETCRYSAKASSLSLGVIDGSEATVGYGALCKRHKIRKSKER